MNPTAAPPSHAADYKPLHGLPALGGLCTMAEAMKPGLSVEACVAQLKRLHYLFRRLHQVFTARITAEPVYELKSAFSLHAHYCAEHTAALRKRVTEMREPPYGLEEVPHAALEILCDEILAAPTTGELLLGLYEQALPALKAGLESHIAATNPLVDAPSVRVCRFALLEVGDMLDFGAKAVPCLVDAPSRAALAPWLAVLEACVAASRPGEAITLPARVHSAKPFRYDGTPRRDGRFPDPYNMGVNAEVFLYDQSMPAEPKTLMMFYKRLREIDVPEMMASIITETRGKPWGYYRDMTRQLWDEARHAMMGEVGFVQAGVDWPREVMVNFTWSLGLNTQLTPLERHAVLYFIEQGLMPRNGKRFEWEVGLASGNGLSALFQDYDWADEVLHARIGRDWYLPEFTDPKTAVKYGDDCWSKVLMNWSGWREKGLTQHRNWWPGCYRAACKSRGVEPDPAVAAFSTTYEQVRADLKSISGSA
ncbi:MAG: hypothetical protein FJ386_00870 [Verrucomicrobia bacterium]|nr:hypothetical protein [Verrucomicrobiota bacterium]